MLCHLRGVNWGMKVGYPQLYCVPKAASTICDILPYLRLHLRLYTRCSRSSIVYNAFTTKSSIFWGLTVTAALHRDPCLGVNCNSSWRGRKCLTSTYICLPSHLPLWANWSMRSEQITCSSLSSSSSYTLRSTALFWKTSRTSFEKR